MLMTKLRAAALGLALLGASLGGNAGAHNDPREMGAGPGPSGEQLKIEAASKAEMQELASEGTAPVMAGGSTPSPDVGETMAGMDHGAMQGMGHDQDVDNSDKSFGQRLFIWLGKLHNVVIHFPIAMILGAFGLEVLGIFRRHPQWRFAARYMMVIGALGAIVAASLGWFTGGFYLTDRNTVLTAHRYLGMTIAVVSAILAWAGLRRFHHDNDEGKTFALLLGILVIGVLTQAFLGGTFMHGGMHHMDF